MNELLAERGSSQAPFLVQELQSDVRGLRVNVQKIFQRLAEEPDAGKKEAVMDMLNGTPILDIKPFVESRETLPSRKDASQP